MKKEEIISKGTYNKYESENFSEFELRVFVPFFKNEVSIKAFGLSDLDDNRGMDLLVHRINEILNFPEENKKWLKEEIWKHYEVCVANTSYGMVDYKSFDNDVEANKAHFSVFDKNDAFENANINHIHFDITFEDENYFNLEYSCLWEDEHGILITVKDGKFSSIN